MIEPRYDKDGITLYCGDCLEILPQLGAGSVDAVIADPPYCSGGSLEAQKNQKAQGLRSATVQDSDFVWFSSDNMTTGGLVFLLRSVLVCSRRLLVPNRSALICTDWRMVPHVAPALESSGLRYRNMLIWDKGNPALGNGFRPCYEVILEFTNGATEYQAKDGSNLISRSRVHSSQKDHNAQKPVELMAELIRVICSPFGAVLDPFMGSGTTGVACIQTGRRFIGIEIDEKYYQIAERRIREAQRQIRMDI